MIGRYLMYLAAWAKSSSRALAGHIAVVDPSLLDDPGMVRAVHDDYFAAVPMCHHQ